MQKSKKQKVSPAIEGLIKQCLGALKGLKKSHLAPPFTVPVDWKGLNLPMYPKMIKHPMDLGTVEKKLVAGKYGTTADFAADVNQVWLNAELFNTEGSEIYDAAQELRELFESQMNSVADGPLSEGGGGGGGGSGGGGSSGGPLSGDELAQSKAVLKEIRKKESADPFLTAVDWKALGIPDYPTVIKRPMDLGTVLSQLEAGQYSSARQVAADVDLVWTNAMQ